MSLETLVVFVTAPDETKAAELARILVEEQLAACGNILPRIRSIYRWEGKICDEGETLLLLKTTPARFEALKARVLTLHPYEVPEIIGLRVDAGHEAYVRWIAGSTGTPG